MPGARPKAPIRRCSVSSMGWARRCPIAGTRVSTPTSSQAGSAKAAPKRNRRATARRAVRCPPSRAPSMSSPSRPRDTTAGDGFPQHFGFLIAAGERADLRPLPNGVMIYGDTEQRLDPLPQPQVPRAEVIDELHAAVGHRVPPLHSGEWSLATIEVCLAMLRSAREQREILLDHQVAVEA